MPVFLLFIPTSEPKRSNVVASSPRGPVRKPFKYLEPRNLVGFFCYADSFKGPARQGGPTNNITGLNVIGPSKPVAVAYTVRCKFNSGSALQHHHHGGPHRDAGGACRQRASWLPQRSQRGGGPKEPGRQDFSVPGHSAGQWATPCLARGSCLDVCYARGSMLSESERARKRERASIFLTLCLLCRRWAREG